MEVFTAPARLRGLTLVELIATLAVALILLGVGIPAWGNLAQSNAITVARNQMQSTLMHARLRAIQLDRHVTVCPSLDQTSCSSDHTAWSKGYITFIDADANRQRDRGETLIRVSQAARSGIQIHSSSGRKSIRFGSDGNAWGSNLTLRFCSPRNVKYNRTILVYGTGRSRLSRTMSDGSAVFCKE